MPVERHKHVVKFTLVLHEVHQGLLLRNWRLIFRTLAQALVFIKSTNGLVTLSNSDHNFLEVHNFQENYTLLLEDIGHIFLYRCNPQRLNICAGILLDHNIVQKGT